MVVNLHDEVLTNKRKSMFLIVGFLIFCFILFAIASFFLNPQVLDKTNKSIESYLFTLSIFLGVTIIYILIFLKSGDKMILKISGAVETSRKEHPHLFHSVEALSISAGMKVPPKCYVIKDSALNAFATGFKPEKSYVVVTTGLIERLNRQEIEGVLAHEISHIKNQDIKVMLLVAGLIGVFTLIGTFCYYMSWGSMKDEEGNNLRLVFLGLWILFSFIAPFFALFFKFAISRKREFLADSNGALLTRYPEGLASALEKIKKDPDPLVDHANKATAHLFISTPFRKKVSGLFATHPPIDERIKKLRDQN
jgi:heat shock protein HtpX